VSDWAWRQATGFVSAAADPAASNEALMELGATICTPANPRCLACPVSHLCAAHGTGKADRIPAPKRRVVRKDLVFVCARLIRTDGAVLLEQRPPDGLWGGLWQPPTVESADGEALGAAAAAEMLGVGLPVAPAGIVPFATTHRAIRFVVFEAKVRGKGATLAAHGRRWVTPGELPGFALSNAAKRVLGL
jgi:A/G-specific adenine glycosylase